MMGEDYRLGHAYLMATRKPVLAAINGPCAGLGFVIAMLCDIRFASDRAVFTTSFAQRGLVAEHGISWILPRLIGPAHAMDLLLSGRRFDAAEAERLGVVNRTIEHDRLLGHARDYLTSLATHSAPRSLQTMRAGDVCLPWAWGTSSSRLTPTWPKEPAASASSRCRAIW